MEEARKRDSVNGDTLVRLGGALSCLWLFWAAKTVWLIAKALKEGALEILALTLFALFFVIAFETFLKTLPKRYVAHVLMTIVVALIVYGHAFADSGREGIHTDELFFSVAAVREVLHGHNPYGEDLLKYVPLLIGANPEAGFFTKMLGGGTVSTVPYPALSILLYVPAVALRFSPHWIGYFGFIAALLVLTGLAPPQFRTLAPLALFVNPGALEYVNSGVEDILYIAPLVLAAFFWTEMPVLAGAALGVACAVKQVPWLFVPFFLIGVYAAGDGPPADRSRKTLAALAAVVVAFAVPNLPFAATAPLAWMQAVLSPITGTYVADGIGLVTLNNYWDVLPRAALLVLSGAIFIVGLMLSVRFFAAMRNAMWLIPGLALFVAPRSLENYFMYLIPIAMVSWFGQMPHAAELKENLRSRWRSNRFGRLLAS